MLGRSGIGGPRPGRYGRRKQHVIVSGMLWASALASSTSYTPPNLHRVGRTETFASISRRYGTGYERLMEANPGLAPEKLRPGAVIVIPGRIKDAAKKNVAKPGAYIVQNGDTDWSIARRYDIKPSQLRQMNLGTQWTTLRPGAVLKVPVKATTVAAAKPQASSLKVVSSSSKVASSAKHTVTQDDNDWIIARGYGISPKKLREMNPGVDWNRLRPGMKVNVPAKKGDTIARITTKRARVIKDNVLVRSGARTDASRVTMVEYGRFATVADRIGSWYKLKFSGGTVGWVRGDLLQPVSAAMVAQAERESGVRSIRRRTHEDDDTRVAVRSHTDNRSTKHVSERNTRSTRVASYRPSARKRISVPESSSIVALSDGDREGLIGTAMSRLGTRYRWGGTTPNGFDCSGFTGYVYSRHGKRLPRTAKEQAGQGQSVSKDGLKKGDLVFFKTTRSDRISHVGIYVGDGKFVHASSGGGKVRVNNLSDGYYSKRFAGAKRVSGASGSESPEPRSKSSKAKKETSDTIAKADKSASSEKIEEKHESEVDSKPQAVKGTDAVGR